MSTNEKPPGEGEEMPPIPPAEEKPASPEDSRLEVLNHRLETLRGEVRAAIIRNGFGLDGSDRPASAEVRELMDSWISTRQEKTDLADPERMRESIIMMNLSIGQMYLGLLEDAANDTGILKLYLAEQVRASVEAVRMLLVEAEGCIGDEDWHEFNDNAYYLVEDLEKLLENAA